MEIPRSLLDELTEQVNALSASAQALASAALDNIFAEWDGADVAGLRVKCIEALEAIEGTYCDAYAAGAAAEFYDGCRAAQGVRGAYSAAADSRRNPQALTGAVKAMVQYVVNGDVERYRRECLSRIDADVRRSANNCVAYNARKDPKKPKYARVPSGGETCGFCLMLASFGFHYKTEEAASHAHANCDCRIVPEFGKVSIAGYDPYGMYDRYNSCLSALGGRDGVRADWNAMPKAERDAYIASHGNKSGEAFDKYLNKRVAREIELRDPDWYTSNNTHGITFSDEDIKAKKAKAWERDDGEKNTARILNRYGYKTTFWDDELHIANPNGKGKITIGRADLTTGVEIKTLYGASSENTFSSHIANAKNKRGVRVIVIDVSKNQSVTDEQAASFIASSLKRHNVSWARMVNHSEEIVTIKAAD